MADSTSTSIKFDPIAQAIGSRLLKVPRYQRSYAWHKEHVRQYFEDLTKAVADREPEYFLGSIVSTDSGDKEEVVDGQQRLATTVILLSAVRDYFVAHNDVARASQIESEYLFRKDLRTQETLPRLELNATDNDYFIRAVLSRPGEAERAVEPTRPSHEHIRAAAEAARSHVANLASNQSEASERLADLVEYLTKSVRVIWLRAADTANAFILFETLNDRGLDLAISDLLKNHLFLLAEKRIEEVQASWTAMTATVESSAKSVNLTEFIRHMWSSQKGATRERELYAAIKKAVKTKSSAVELAKSLERGAIMYAAALDPEHAFWDSYGTSARAHIQTMNLLGMVQIRPLILAVLESFTPSETKVCLRNMVSWGVRLLVVGGLGGGTMEDHYAGAACQVRDKSITTTSALRKLLSAAIPSDATFREAFAGARVSKAPLARYYLRALERAKAGDGQPELVPNTNEEEIDLEHVMPKTLSASWPVDDDEHTALVKRIGNLVLLKRSENSGHGNDSFAKKRVVLKKSKFVLTASVGKSTAWTAKEINKRQQTLADLALVAWPLK